MKLVIEFTLETFFDIGHMGETCRIQSMAGIQSALAAAADQVNRAILATRLALHRSNKACSNTACSNTAMLLGQHGAGRVQTWGCKLQQ